MENNQEQYNIYQDSPEQSPILPNLYKACEKYLPAEQVEAIRNDMERVNDISEVHAIEILRDTGNLPKEMEKTLHTLERYGVNADLLTIEEAKMLEDYATNASDEVINEKTDTIANTIIKGINGVRSRREIADAERLSEKYERYDRGELDTSRGFDPEDILTQYDKYSHEDNSENPYLEQLLDLELDISKRQYDGTYRDDTERRALAQKLEEWDLDDLLEEGIVPEEDLFVYGPFTGRDLEDVEVFRRSTWIDAINGREKNRVAALLDETVSRNEDTETDLLRQKVAKDILPNHRLNTKNLLLVSAAAGMRYAEEGIPENVPDEERTKFRRHMEEISKYLRKIFMLTPEETKREFGHKAPASSKKFFEEIAARVEAMTEMQEKNISSGQGPYLTKLDENLYLVDAYYEPESEISSIAMIEELPPKEPEEEQPDTQASPESMNDLERNNLLQNFAQRTESAMNIDINDGQ